MAWQLTQGEENLALLERTLPANEAPSLWCYTSEGRLAASNCPRDAQALLEGLFHALGGHRKLMDHARGEDRDRPVLIGSGVGLQWAATQENARGVCLLYVAGPVFYHAPDAGQRAAALEALARRERAGFSGEEALRRMTEIPVISYHVFTRYAVMLHNTLTGQKLSTDDLEPLRPPGGQAPAPMAGDRDRVRIYQAEKAMLDMVRRGDICYQSTLGQSASLSPGVPVSGKDPLRQMKTSVIVFTSLVCRAAMEGGLSPEVAYPLGDSYIQAVENCADSGELSALASTMYHDFIYRVHYLRANPNYSHAIRKCCDYIELSVQRKIRLSDLASLAGYTEYYLSELFRRETGLSVNQYIRRAKVARARLLLTATTLTVSQIADRLAFNTPNYFIQCFREEAGVTPAEYRKRVKGGG